MVLDFYPLANFNPSPLQIADVSYGCPLAHFCPIYLEFIFIFCRGVFPGGARGALAPPDFGRSVNPISMRETDYAHLIANGTPGFSDLLTALFCKKSTEQTNKQSLRCLKISS